eukprot:5410597-Alexandrium_andersonii.AAC.1
MPPRHACQPKPCSTRASAPSQGNACNCCVIRNPPGPGREARARKSVPRHGGRISAASRGAARL